MLNVMTEIVFNGYQGWTTQRSSAGGILGREWLQRRQMFRLRCHDFELTKPARWGYTNQRHRYRLGRFWVQFLGQHWSLA